MMLAAAFRSCVRSSGSWMTSSRKLITLHLSSWLVSKSCGKTGWVSLAAAVGRPQQLGPGPRKAVLLSDVAGCWLCHPASMPGGHSGVARLLGTGLGAKLRIPRPRRHLPTSTISLKDLTSPLGLRRSFWVRWGHLGSHPPERAWRPSGGARSAHGWWLLCGSQTPCPRSSGQGGSLVWGSEGERTCEDKAQVSLARAAPCTVG